MNPAQETQAERNVPIASGQFRLFTWLHLAALVVLIGLSYWIASDNYLLFHTFSEVFSISIATGIFFFSWTARRNMQSQYLVYLGIAYLCIGALDLVHTISYKGLPILHDGNNLTMSSQIWVFTRWLESLSLLIFLALPKSFRLSESLVFILYVVLFAVGMLWIVVFESFPITYLPETGLTPFKIASEYFICVILAASAWILYRQRQEYDPSVLQMLLGSIVATILSELFFTVYIDLYGLANQWGHICKIISFYLLYKAVIHNGISAPFTVLFHNLKQQEELLQEHHDRLNELVLERTQDLEEANNKLLNSNNRLQNIQKELIEAKNQAEALSNVKSDFLSIMNHELRTPMNGVLGMAQLLMQDVADPEIKSQIRVIYDSGRALVNILDDIMELTRIEEHKKTLRKKNIDLNNTLQTLYDIYTPSFKLKNLDFRLENQLENSFFYGDEESCAKILTNLLANALKFTEKGTVVLRVQAVLRRDGQYVRFEVEDTGIGIAEKQQSSIFMAFTQGDNSSTRAYGGIGLGLTLVKKLINLLHGTLGFDSELGKGSLFWVELPFEQQVAPQHRFDEPKLPTTSQVLKPDREFSYNLLVVEDDPTNQKVIERILRRYNIHLTMANNGQDALTMVKGFSYDMILMDCLMPIMDGFEATEAIRRMEGKGEIKGRTPILALTAKVLREDEQKAMAAGMDGFLRKPLEILELEEQINRLIGGTLLKRPLSV